MTPLFIPLKREFFEAFKNGTKTVEYRKAGPRWNTRTLIVGRPVVLSLGYGKGNRLSGAITMVDWKKDTASIPGWRECYGETPDAIAACISIEIIKPAATPRRYFWEKT